MTKLEERIVCDECGETTTAIDAGFDPVALGMVCKCGGKWSYSFVEV